jgi:hypothetical protein
VARSRKPAPLQRGEPFLRAIFAFLERVASAYHRAIDRFVRQLERAVMMGRALGWHRNRPSAFTASDGFMCWSLMNQRGS